MKGSALIIGKEDEEKIPEIAREIYKRTEQSNEQRTNPPLEVASGKLSQLQTEFTDENGALKPLYRGLNPYWGKVMLARKRLYLLHHMFASTEDQQLLSTWQTNLRAEDTQFCSPQSILTTTQKFSEPLTSLSTLIGVIRSKLIS